MPKYLKKESEVEAFRLFIDAVPDWCLDAIEDGKVALLPGGKILIKTVYGEAICQSEDYIVKNTAGCIYPCKKEVFEMYCEPVSGN